MLLPLFVCFLNLFPLQFFSTDLWAISRKKSGLDFESAISFAFYFFCNFTSAFETLVCSGLY